LTQNFIKNLIFLYNIFLSMPYLLIKKKMSINEQIHFFKNQLAAAFITYCADNSFADKRHSLHFHTGRISEPLQLPFRINRFLQKNPVIIPAL